MRSLKHTWGLKGRQNRQQKDKIICLLQICRRRYLPEEDIFLKMEKRKKEKIVRLTAKLTRTGEGEKQVALETITKKGRLENKQGFNDMERS